MSKVISFRLSPDNPRDTKALAVLRDWLSRGFSTRHTITEALLNLSSTDSEVAYNEVLKDLSQQIEQLLDSIVSDISISNPKEKKLTQEILSEGFVSSTIKSAKPGLKVNTKNVLHSEE